MAKKDKNVDTIEEIMNIDEQPKKIKVHKSAILKTILVLIGVIVLVFLALKFLADFKNDTQKEQIGIEIVETI